MVHPFDAYCSWLTTNQGTEYEGDFKTELLNSMRETPAYQEDAKINGVKRELAMVRKGSKKCRVTALTDDEFFAGDIIDAIGESWLIMEATYDEYGILNGEAWMCNQVFSFQKFDRSIVTKYAVIDDGSYSKQSDKSIILISESYNCYMGLDYDTDELYVDKRLAIDKLYDATGKQIIEVGKITHVDKKSMNFGAGSHLIKLRLDRDVYDEHKDRIDMMLCDFVDPVEPPHKPVQVSMQITGKQSLKIGTTRTYTAALSNGDSLDGVEIIWELEDAPAGIILESNGNACVITCPFEYTYAGDTFKVSCVDSDTIYDKATMEVDLIDG